MVKLRVEKLLDKYGALAAFLVPFAAPPSERENAKMVLESLIPNKPGIHH